MDDYNHRMFALRYAYVLALVVWLGGIVALGAIVAPTTFGVLQGLRPDVGRELAGAVFSVGSITYCGSLPHNKFDNDVSRLTFNVLNRFGELGLKWPFARSEA